MSYYWVKMRPVHTDYIVGFSYTCSSDPTKWVKCEPIKTDCKIQLVPLEPGFAIESYFESDFRVLMEDGIIVKDSGQQVIHTVDRTYLSPGAYLLDEGDTLV